MRPTAIIAIALIAALLIACEEQEALTPQVPSLPEDAIAFTHGAAAESGPLSADDQTNANIASMTVYAHYTGAANFAAATATATPDFMFNQPVEKDEDGYWTYSPPKYWPGLVDGTNLGKVSFFALAPMGATGVQFNGSNTTTGYPSFTVSPATSPKDQQDICVAAAIDQTRETANGKVNFSFDHALAKINFAARYISDTDVPFGIVLRELTLTGIYTTNTLRFTASGFEWNAVGSASAGSYTLSVDDATLVDTSLLKSDETGNARVSTPEGTLLLVPQTVPADASLKVTLWLGGNRTVVRTISLPEGTELEAGKEYNYNLTLEDDGLSAVLTEQTWDYDFAGKSEHFVAPQDGTYKLEAWGAGAPAATDNEGVIKATGGQGGYSAGNLVLKAGQILYIYVGEMKPGTDQPFNGGAPAASATTRATSGGGATDFRLLSGAWDNPQSLNSRILVAGGGGGAGWDSNGNRKGYGGYGGGLTGGNGTYSVLSSRTITTGKGGSQTAGGAGGTEGIYTAAAGSFGAGSKGASNTNVGSGGGGYYGGSGAARAGGVEGAAGGGGGSSFISGMTGCVAINPASITEPRAQDASGNTTALNYNTTLFGISSTWADGEDILFTTPEMIDGNGFDWSSGARAATATGMPSPSGGTITGNTGHGYARITYIAPQQP